MQRSGQIVAIAPTWVANNTISEQETRKLEPDERIWAREYQAIPQAGLSNAFDPTAVRRAFRSIQIASSHERVGVVDLSSGRGDALAYGVASWCMPDLTHISEFLMRPVSRRISTRLNGQDVMLDDRANPYEVPQTDDQGRPIPNPERARLNHALCVMHVVDSISGRFSGAITSTKAVEQIARVFKRHGVRHVIGDHYEQFFAASEFKRHQLHYHPIPWTGPSKTEAVTRIKRLFAEDRLVLPEREKLRNELLNYTEKISSTGHVSYSARGSGHDDECSLLISFAHGELENLVPGAPLHIPTKRHEVQLIGDERKLLF